MDFGSLPPFGAAAPDLERVVFRDHGTMLGRVIGSDILLIACVCLAILAAFTLTGLLTAQRERRFAARLARRRGQRMNELMRTVRLAEDIAELGVWQYDFETGRQQWSNGMRRLFGVDHSEPFVEGDAETLLHSHNIDLVGAAKQRLEERDTYTLVFDIVGLDGSPRTLSVEACNLRGGGGKPSSVIAVIQDITEEVSHVRELEFSRAAAVREASRARELAETDPLTGLANRRRVMAKLDRMIADARRFSQPLALVVFDIDHFKSVNDTFGHVEGDKVLQSVATIAKAQAREGDVVARVGGEEFVWVVPGAGEGAARVMAERLRVSVASESATCSVPPVTISAGYAELCPGDTSLSLFARADGALYEAKHAGRNRVRMAA